MLKKLINAHWIGDILQEWRSVMAYDSSPITTQSTLSFLHAIMTT
jgi:hypothetical protein